MRYISLFSGIEACSVAWKDFNWDAVAFADFDDFPSAVLEHHYPDVPNLKDVVKVDWSKYEGAADLVVGGSPCQSFSVAGKRLGMDDPRGNLALHYLRVVGAVRPRWFLYENVPGLLSSNDGDDFSIFLGEVAKLGYGFAYRVLDAQHFGVPQRRRRVFVVGCADGDWRSAAAVLFDKKSLNWNLASSQKKGEGASLFSSKGIGGNGKGRRGRGINESNPAGSLTAGMYHHGSINNQCLGTNAHLIMEDAFVFDSLSSNSMKSRNPNSGCRKTTISPTLDTLIPSPAKNQGGIAIVQKSAIPIHDKATRHQGGGPDRKDDGAGNGFGVGREGDPLPTLDTKCNHAVFQQQGVDFNQELTGDIHCPLRTAGGHGAPAVMQRKEVAGIVSKGNGDVWETPERHMSLTSGGGLAGQGYAAIREDTIVRRLTPLECERLQGFPDDYSKIPWKGKPADECPDSHRYKALGNSMAVPVMKWLGERIDMMHSADLSNRAKPKARKQMTLW